MHLCDSWSRIKTTAIVFSRTPPVKVRSSPCCVNVAVLAPGTLPSSVLFPAGWTLSSPCHPDPYLSLMSVVPWVCNGILLGLSIFIPLMTDEFTLLCIQHRPIPSVKCLYHLSIRLLGVLTDFLVKFFIVMCEMMNPLWDLWVINIVSTSMPYIVLMVFSGK